MNNSTAFLLDFDGPFFNNDLIQTRLMRILNISKTFWDAEYKAARVGENYVNYGQIVGKIAHEVQIPEEHLWNILSQMMKDTVFFTQEARDALLFFKKCGHVEIITQGNKRFQKAKIEATGVTSILSPNDIYVIEEDKRPYLIQRASELLGTGYSSIIQIDDRVGPLVAVQDVFSEHVMAVRVSMGKYRDIDSSPKEVRSPESGRHLWLTTNTIQDARQLLGSLYFPHIEGSVRSDRMRK